MTLSSTALFSKPLTSVPDVIKDVFQIFGARWKIILPIVAVQTITAMGLGILFFGTLFAIIQAGYYIDNNNRYRHLVQHVATGGSTHRYLGDNYSWSDYAYYATSDDDYIASHAKYYGISDVSYYMGTAFAPFVISVAVFALVAVLINSVFTGALVRVIAEAYTDKTPTLSESLGFGWSNKFKIFGYSVLFFIVEVLAGFLIVMLPSMLAGDGLSDIIMMFLLITYGTLSTAAKSAIVCGIPSIIVEKQTVGGAYKRSWELCKSKVCFIFGCIFSLAIIEMVVSFILSSISKGLSDFIGLVFPPLFSIMSVVLYMNIRMQAEEFSSATLSTELDTSSNDFVAITTDEVPSNKEMAASVV